MRKQMMENAAFDVAAQVRSVEESIEAALLEIADLQSKMIHARGVTGAGFFDSQDAFRQLAATNCDLMAARGAIANCHAALVETKKVIPGLRTTGWGDQGECPKTASAELRVVA